MGFWNTLKKAFFRGHVRWDEPFCFRMRLRREFGSRLLLAGSVLLLVFAAFSLLPVSLEGFWVGGLLFGFLAGGGVFLWPEVKVKSVALMDDAIECRWTTYWGEFFVVHEQRYRYDTIVRAVIVPAEALGKRFSVLVLATPLAIETLGISRRTDPQEVANFLASRGVVVAYSREIPARAFSPRTYPRWLTPAATVTGVILLLAGVVIYPTRFAGDRDKPRFARPEGLTRPKSLMDLDESRALRRPGQERGSRLDLLPGGISSGASQPQQQAAQPEPAPGGAAGAEAPPSGMAFGPRMQSGSGAQPTLPRGTATELIGGTGGMLYHSVGSGAPVLGFGHAMGSWAGEQALAALEPVFVSESGPATQHVIACEGYAVGALEIDAPKYISAVRVLFMRLGADGRLDPNDSYKSDWIGTPSGKPTRTVGGDGRKVIGIQARRAAVLDAVGLVVE